MVVLRSNHVQETLFLDHLDTIHIHFVIQLGALLKARFDAVLTPLQPRYQILEDRVTGYRVLHK